jgi:hypothetical protein
MTNSDGGKSPSGSTTPKAAEGELEASPKSFVFVLESASMVDSGVMSMFASSKKRPRRHSPQPTLSCGLVSAAEIHATDVSNSDAFEFRGYLLYYPDALRWASVTNNRNRSQEIVPVLNVLLADQTGPVQMELWRQAAVDAFHNFELWTAEPFVPVPIVVSRFVVRNLARRNVMCFPPSRRIVSSNKTAIRRAPAGMQLPGSLAPTMYISDFSVLKREAPFIASVQGIVSAVEAESEAQSSGTPMRGFKLHAADGCYVRCLAYGRHVDNECLQAGNQIILYFCSAQSGLGSSSGQLWLYNESHIVRVKSGVAVPPATTLLDFDA